MRGHPVVYGIRINKEHIFTFLIGTSTTQNRRIFCWFEKQAYAPGIFYMYIKQYKAIYSMEITCTLQVHKHIPTPYTAKLCTPGAEGSYTKFEILLDMLPLMIYMGVQPDLWRRLMGLLCRDNQQLCTITQHRSLAL